MLEGAKRLPHNCRMPITFSGNPLDRAGHRRGDAAWLAAQMDDKAALFVPFWKLQPLILPEAEAGAGRDVGWLPADAVKPAPDALATGSLVFLGVNRRGKPLFAVDVSHLTSPEDSGPFAHMGVFEELRALAALGDLPDTELAILAQGKAMLDWHARHGFCAACGGATAAAEGGYKRRCGACGAEHFPRTDPVVIMLATHDDACLVGRQRGWPEGAFSALAGFMEPGESIEEAVAREMDEEAGVGIEAVRYCASQPWPFPASLMIGCLATATGRDLSVDGVELESAQWVARDDIRAVLAGGESDALRLPPKMAIARRLIEIFAEGG